MVYNIVNNILNPFLSPDAQHHGCAHDRLGCQGGRRHWRDCDQHRFGPDGPEGQRERLAGCGSGEDDDVSCFARKLYFVSFPNINI